MASPHETPILINIVYIPIFIGKLGSHPNTHVVKCEITHKK